MRSRPVCPPTQVVGPTRGRLIGKAFALLTNHPTRADGLGAAAPVRIGLLFSMFRNVKPSMVNAMSKPFYSLFESQTGLKTEFLIVPLADELRTQLVTGRVPFGVFHRFEFAWMKL